MTREELDQRQTIALIADLLRGPAITASAAILFVYASEVSGLIKGSRLIFWLGDRSGRN